MTIIHLSLVTSLYRAEAHLENYIHHAVEVAGKVASLKLEFIVVANDATPRERELINHFSTLYPHVRAEFVLRETLYASWNRGVRLASGNCIGFWNVDDVRTAEGLIAGYEKIQQGCQLVYFPYAVIRPGAIMPYHRRRVYEAVPYDPDLHRRVMKCGPFFLFSPALYEQVGAFDERFRIIGDWEWCARATDYADFCPVSVHAGDFYLHGANLSSTGNPLQIAEDNVLFLLRGMWDSLKPADPDLMRQTWAKWDNGELPPEIQEKLWGKDARANWHQWQIDTRRKRRRAELEQALRFIPKTVIDSFGVRSSLARLGFVKDRK